MSTQGALTITISGSLAAGTAFGPCPGTTVTCLSPNGTYVANCGQKYLWIQTTPWCTVGSINYFSYVAIHISWLPSAAFSSGSGLAVSPCYIELGTSSSTASTSPYPTMTNVGYSNFPFLSQPMSARYVTFSTTPTYAQYACEHDSTCRAECDPGTTRRRCFSGSLSWASDISSGGTNGCGMGSISISGSVA